MSSSSLVGFLILWSPFSSSLWACTSTIPLFLPLSLIHHLNGNWILYWKSRLGFRCCWQCKTLLSVVCSQVSHQQARRVGLPLILRPVYCAGHLVMLFLFSPSSYCCVTNHPSAVENLGRIRLGSFLWGLCGGRQVLGGAAV